MRRLRHARNVFRRRLTDERFPETPSRRSTMTCVGRASWRASSPSASILGILGILDHPIPRGTRGMGRSSCACSGTRGRGSRGRGPARSGGGRFRRRRLRRRDRRLRRRRRAKPPSARSLRGGGGADADALVEGLAEDRSRARPVCRCFRRQTREGRVAARPRRSSSEGSPSRPCTSPGSTPLRASGAARAPGAALRSDFLFRERARNERGKIAMTGNDRRLRFVTRGYRRDAASAPYGGKKKRALRETRS